MTATAALFDGDLDRWIEYLRLLRRRIDLGPMGRVRVLTAQQAFDLECEEGGRALAIRRWQERDEPGQLLGRIVQEG